MDPFEVAVQGEQFRISERTQPGGAMSYDCAWLNGLTEGTYGFTIGQSFGWAAGEELDADAPPPGRTAEDLVAAVHGFVESFYGPGGSGETDLPNHSPANAEPNERQ